MGLVLKELIKRILANNLFHSVGLYTIASVISKAMPFFLLPIMTRYLTPAEYGIVAMFGVLVGFFSPFIGLSIRGAITRQYFEKKVDMPIYTTNCIYILICSTVIVSFIIYLLSEQISAISSFPIEWLWVVITVSFFSFIVQIVLIFWRVCVKPIYYGVFTILHTALNVSLSIWLVVVLNYGWEGRILALLYSMIVFAIIAIMVLWKEKWIKFSFNKSYIKNALIFGVPLIPHIFGSKAITMTDRFLITNMIGLADTGIYSVGYKIGSIISLLATSFVFAWSPWFYGKLKENSLESKYQIIKYTYFYFGAIIFFALIFSLCAPILLKFLVGDAFLASTKYVPWIAMGYAFNGMYYVVSGYIFYLQKTYYLSLMTFFSVFLNFGFTYLLILKYGAIGAAQATFISYFIKFFLTWIIAMRLYKMPWKIWNR